LTEIAFAAKRHWGYPERWIQTWAPLLTITPEYIEGHETYLAYIDEQPAGFCAIFQAGERASLNHLWVLPEFMSRGIGKELFEHTLSRCKALGVSVLEIESDPNAQGFYEHMRAKKVGQVVGEIEGQARILPLLEVKL
jgi:GNAT superfamily N-acetyltransferase